MLRIKRLLTGFVPMFLIGVLLFASNYTTVSAISNGDLDSIKNNTPFYDPTDTLSGVCSDSSSTAPTTAIVTNKSQEEHAKTVIGIAKTNGLGKQGAVIGLMTALAESGLRVLANSNVKVSLSNPNKEGTGSNGNSVGIMQQQPQYNWSTIDNGDSALTNKEAVWQLMDPAYAAEAFFGSPRGSKAPDALSKGLQNKANWQELDPWAAAQLVQGSAFGDGSNYKAQLGAARTLVEKLWDESAPVPLPVPFDGNNKATSDSVNASATCNGTTTSTDLGVGKGKFTDDASTSFPGVEKALARAQEIAKLGALWKQVCAGNDNGPNCYGWCDHMAAEVWNHPASGYESALVHWFNMVSGGYAHPDSRKVPVGALLFYSGSSRYGHAAVYLGNNKVASTDVLDGKSGVTGGFYIADAAALETGPWHLTYLGWSTPVFGDGKFFK